MIKNVILEGVVGSSAYGLAREGSDVDKLGIYLDPTRFVVDLYWTDTHATKTGSYANGDDFTYHELKKYLRLALGGNPTVMELLWLPEYTKITNTGYRLVDLREAFLSEKTVRNAYLGYARQQLEKLRHRKTDFSSATKNRTPKHARHCMRLARQGAHLLETGELFITVQDPQEYWAFDDMTPDEMIDTLESELVRLETAKSTLPERPDSNAVNDFLVKVRLNN